MTKKISSAEPADYADHIVEIVRHTRGHIGLAEIPGTVGRRHLLEKRVRDILSFRRDNIPNKARHLGRIFMICTLCLLPLLLINPGIAGDSRSDLKEELFKKIYGVWVNEDYIIKPGETGKEVKWTFKPDGTWETSNYLLTQVIPPFTGTYNIRECWADSEENSWYKIIMESCACGMEHNYFLLKLSANNTTLEFAFSNIDYPAEIVKNSYRVSYRIYYSEDVI